MAAALMREDCARTIGGRQPWELGRALVLGSGAIGFLYDRSVMAAVVFCVAAELAAAPFFLWVARRRTASA